MSDITVKMKPGQGFPAGGFDDLAPPGGVEKKESSGLARYRSDNMEDREVKKVSTKFNAKVYSQYKILGELQHTDTYKLIAEALDAYLPELLENGTTNSRLKTTDIYFKKVGQYFYTDTYQKYAEISAQAKEIAKKANKRSKDHTYILINVAMQKYLPTLRRKYKAKENMEAGLERLGI